LKQNAAEVATLPPRGKTRELIADLAGVSARTAQDAITVYEGDTELFRKVKEGRLAVAAAAESVRRRGRDDGIPTPPPLPAGVFDLIYADPPWRLGSTDSERGPDRHYPTMTVDQIAVLQIPAAKDAVLFLWVVDGHQPEALEVVTAWGFTPVNSIIWVKNGIGLGAWVRNQHEQLLIAKRGRFSPPPPELRIASVVHAKRGRHSEKPAVFYELIEHMYPQTSKLELFARRQRAGWAAWGNQVPDA
jgi:N6-adenosine-specific RNA methylase IME4